MWPCPVPVSGRIARAVLRGRELELSDVALATLGGSFRGSARLRDLARYSVEGEISGFDARRVVALYSAAPLPWTGGVSGAIRLAGVLGQPKTLRVTADLAIVPEPGAVPVTGRITAGYEAASGLLDLGRSTITLPASHLEFSGAIGRTLSVHLQTRDLNELLPALGTSAAQLHLELGPSGSATFNGTVTGVLSNPRIDGRLAATRFSYAGRAFDAFQAKVGVSSGSLRLAGGSIARGPARATFDLTLGLQQWKPDALGPISGEAALHAVNASDLAQLAGLKDLPATGTVEASGRISGTLDQPVADAYFEASHGTILGEPYDHFAGKIVAKGRVVELAGVTLTAGPKQILVSASYERTGAAFDAGRLRFELHTNAMPLESIQKLREGRTGLAGTLEAKARGTVDLKPGVSGAEQVQMAELSGEAALRGIRLDGKSLGDARLTATSQSGALRAHLESNFAGAAVRGEGEWRLGGSYPGTATVSFTNLALAPLRAILAPGVSDAIHASVDGTLRVEGPATDWQALRAELRLSRLDAGPAPGKGEAPDAAVSAFALRNAGPVVATLTKSAITIESARLTGRATDLVVSGRIQLNQEKALDLRVSGRIHPGILQDFDSDITASGSLVADASIRGRLGAPMISGKLSFNDVALNVAGLPNGISKANGAITFSGDRAIIQSFTAESGGGRIVLTGNVGFGGTSPIFRLHARIEEVRVRYPPGVSTVADASLNLTGTSERSMLSGTVTVLRTSFNPQSDFSSLLATSAEPVRTPAAPKGPLAGLNYDIQIVSAPDIQVRSSLAQDVQIEANLRLRGTVTSPALLGRVNVTQGQLQFFGTRYTINQGSISFYNPVKIDPVFDLNLETRARSVEITLTISGHLNDLKLTPRSDPPLQFNEIVALLAMGRTPTWDPTAPALGPQVSTPNASQLGASALLGQAISSPVPGRLQHFFGVSRLRIDPTLPGIQYNPQARVTLEQQVTPEITFTYITNVTNSNPQVVSVEWDFSKLWSAVAIREENGVFGLDFFYRRRFK
jgi:translocation and assembly module TamB